MESSQIQRMIEIAKMYYEEGLTQLQIAKKLNVSRALIASQLSSAKEMGIVNIEIKSSFTGNEELLAKLKRKFNILGGVITPSSKGDFYQERVLINQTCKFIAEEMEKAAHIGMGWGFSLDEVIKNFTELNLTSRQRTICPLLANLDSPHRGFHPNELVRVLAEKTMSESTFIYAPVFPLSLQEQLQFTNTENYKQIEEEWSRLDLAIIAISPFPSVPDLATAYRYGDSIINEKVVGDLISYCFNRNGEIVLGENDFVIRIPLEYLQRIENVIAICPNNISPEAVVGALNTGIVKNIIMEEKIAFQCLNM